MNTANNHAYYPDQRTSRKKKEDKSFYIPLAKYCIGRPEVVNKETIVSAYNAVNGIIDEKLYKKILNPYNSTDEKYKRFPADLRNYDMTGDIIRRYMGEFIKQNFKYNVSSVDPDVAIRFNKKLMETIIEKASKIYVQNVNAALANDPEGQTEIPDFVEFFEEFKQTYVDEYAINGSKALNAMIEFTNSVELYYNAFYDYLVSGFTISYRDIRNGQLFKEIIHPTSFKSVGVGKWIKDHDICVRDFEITYSDLVNKMDDVLEPNVIKSLKELLKTQTDNLNNPIYVPLQYFHSIYGSDVAHSLTSAGHRQVQLSASKDTIKGSHITFKTEVPIYYVQRIDLTTGVLIDDIVEADSYTINPELGEIAATKDWINEIYEMYVFGNNDTGIYSKPRPIAYQQRPSDNPKECYQPYNGFYELITGSGYTFSIPNIIMPFQTLRNILFYAREKTIAKNKDIVTVIPKSILGNKEEEVIYKMEASGMLIYDDSDDENNMRANAIKAIGLSLHQYIDKLTSIIDTIKEEAWDIVDMNSQRYGDIVASAGKGTTQEAIVRSSMGSVLIYTMFDKFLESDYESDLNYSKLILSNAESVITSDGVDGPQVVPFDSEIHVLADYKMKVRNTAIDKDKKDKLDNILFAMSQNGEFEPAINSLLEDSITGIKRVIKEYNQNKQAMEKAIALEKEQIEAQTAQINAQTEQAKMEHEKEITLIKEEGQDRRKAMELQIKLMEVLNQVEGTLKEGDDLVNNFSNSLDQMKLNLSEKQHNDNIQLRKEDMQIKRDKMRSDEKIAKMNKN